MKKETEKLINDINLINDFMGYVKDERFFRIDGSGIWGNFHSSWDRIIPVVQKCYETDNEERFNSIVDAVATLDLNATFKAVVEFIKSI